MISKKELEKAFDQRFPKEIKRSLADAHVAIAGLGGLGSNIAMMLARTGVGHMLLVDFDNVDVTNLNRQMYTIKHIGRPKTEALYEMLMEINPYLEIEYKTVKITEENVSSIFGSYRIVCEALDNPGQKAMLVNGLLLECPDTVIVSGNGMAGYGDANEIKTKKKLGRLYVCGDNKTDIAEGMGLMAPRVAICAGHQANKVVQIILESEQE